jgi:hypothetical protein
MERRLIAQHIEDRHPLVNIMEGERENAMRQGYEKAKKTHGRWGRTPATWPNGWEVILTDVSMMRISNVRAIQLLGMAATTYYKLIRETQASIEKEPLLWADKQDVVHHIMRLAPHGKRHTA